MSAHEHEHGEAEPNWFEPDDWEVRYAGDGRTWSGRANPQLVDLIAPLQAGTALDVGCGEGGDVVWLAQHGWRTTGADFSANGLARAARHAADAGVADRTDWMQVDARDFDAAGRTWDLVTTHFLHPGDGGMADVVGRLAAAVAPGGHLLVVGHAPTGHFAERSTAQLRAMFLAADLVPALPDGFDILVAEERGRTAVHDGVPMDVEDATLFARRR
ncbi:methyltransferase domain-containing protein [Agromyces seonyuensis]|uniref:methyltransferase domain-containing protein n=1 Tax=Agromyces seonyuensis TaxID=2662446 RepID=UPI0019245241